jgi:hypothetical protein
MIVNIGATERLFRVLLGLLLVLLTLTNQIGFWGFLGLILVVTGGSGHCPPYHWFGINTCRLFSKR